MALMNRACGTWNELVSIYYFFLLIIGKIGTPLCMHFNEDYII